MQYLLEGSHVLGDHFHNARRVKILVDKNVTAPHLLLDQVLLGVQSGFDMLTQTVRKILPNRE